jgi:cell division protein FtsI/penicillin-binding protein 2
MTSEPLSIPIETNRLETRRWRVYLVAAVIVGFALVLMARLVYLQAIENTHFRSMATEEHWRRSILPPRRGDIVDSNGNPLATSVTYQSLYASTTVIKNPAHVADVLAPLLGESPATLQSLLSKTQLAPVLIKRWLPDDVASKVNELGIDGVFLQLEPKRVYPQGDLAAQVLGVVGVDNNGLSGLELEFNPDIAGKPGELVAERDTAGDAIAFGPHKYTAPINGSTVTLTIDRYVQWVAERELQAAMERNHAKGGSVVVLDPRTGAVLAMAGRPTFHPDDPNLYSTENVARYNIPAVSDAYEPGTTFKIITMAAALDTGTVAPDTSFVDPGYFTYYGGTIRNTIPRPPGPETMTQTLISSSNVGISWVATRVGAPRFYDYARAFGIGRPTGIELPGEAGGLLRMPTAADWFPFDLVTNSYGQGLSATPLQMAVAIAAVANGGKLMKPYVVKKIEGGSGARMYYPTVEGQVIHAETAANLTKMLVAVIDDRTSDESRFARVPGYAVAGTSSITSVPVAGGNPSSEAIASFVGYAPAEDPRFVILVRIDAPRDTPAAENVAAPVFGAIAKQLLNYYQIPPSRPAQGIGT